MPDEEAENASEDDSHARNSTVVLNTSEKKMRHKQHKQLKLQRYRLRHMCAQIKRIVCRACHEEFSSKRDLRRHLSPAFYCLVCLKGYSDYRDLKRHNYTIHGENTFAIMNLPQKRLQ